MPRLQRVHEHETDSPSADPPTRVVLANDHPGLRRSFLWLLDDADELDVVGEATDLEATLRELVVQSPQVLVLDLRMPDGFSAERIKQLRSGFPRTQIVVTTMNANEAFANEAFKAGAVGFVAADSADRELVDAVRRAARGLPYTSPRVRRAVA